MARTLLFTKVKTFDPQPQKGDGFKTDVADANLRPAHLVSSVLTHPPELTYNVCLFLMKWDALVAGT